ncbi:MAG TPA: trehalose-6-phosphate synthase [Anaerolineales bacterium]|nr:trehalose-6-phosphate synthase [Anaerolineales bacterium]
MNDTDPLIVIVSNRGPFSFKEKKDGSFDVTRGAGGLVTALGALAEKHDVLWVAAAMSEDDRRWAEHTGGAPARVDGVLVQLVIPEAQAYERYYNVIANPLLWFLQHQLWDIPRAPLINQRIWEAWDDGYKPINRQFAEAVAGSIAGAVRPVIVLPQDYHLYMFPRYLRALVGDRAQIQPFIHIPWPGPDAWRVLPPMIRSELLASMLTSDRIGFQTRKDAFNFVQTCRFYLEEAHSGGARDSIDYGGRAVTAAAYPISIDVEQVEALVEEPQTHLLKSQFINFVGDQDLILRVDRIEPSKNILRGLEAYRTLLELYPEHRGRVQMLGLLVPSRMEVDEYQDYLREIMSAAGMINAAYSEAFWEPVRIVVGENYPRAIAAMQLYDVLLVNSIADGMNLVAKEGALVNRRDGVIVLSEHVGAFYEMGAHTIPVSPFDIYGTTQAIHQALTMPAEERRERAEALREIVRSADVRRWFQNQVDDALRALESQASRVSTSETPEARMSEASSTA